MQCVCVFVWHTHVYWHQGTARCPRDLSTCSMQISPWNKKVEAQETQTIQPWVSHKYQDDSQRKQRLLMPHLKCPDGMHCGGQWSVLKVISSQFQEWLAAQNGNSLAKDVLRQTWWLHAILLVNGNVDCIVRCWVAGLLGCWVRKWHSPRDGRSLVLQTFMPLATGVPARPCVRNDHFWGKASAHRTSQHTGSSLKILLLTIFDDHSPALNS